MSSTAEQTRIIEPSKGWLSLNLGEVWRYRELLQLLVWRNTTVRYKQSVIGIGWAVIRPVVSMVIFTIIFGRMAKLPSDGVPYPIFTFVALLPWTYFAGSLGGTTISLVGSANLITKVYFPRLILPLSNLFSGLVDFCVSFVVLIGLMIWYRDLITLSWTGIACLPLFLFLSMMAAFAFGLWFTSLNVKYRDIGHLIPFVTQIWMYITPVAYSSSLVPERWLTLYSLNPMVGVIDGFRWALLGRTNPDWNSILLSAGVTIVVMITGLFYFKRMERTFVDII